MKRSALKKWIILLGLFVFLLLMTACSYVETSAPSEYPDFWRKMQKEYPYIAEFIPELNDCGNIDDCYLYYSDKDPLATYYAVYLNCVYSDEQYASELERLSGFVDEYTCINSPSFDLPSIEINNCLTVSPGEYVYVRYLYTLFNCDNNQIIYVMAYESGQRLRTGNIPVEFLPDEWFTTQQSISGNSTGDVAQSTENTDVCSAEPDLS